ncbi:hypothetical protein [Nonomuraea soli]|uniref:Septum formation initiator family protein n=1 Tax=Nonomuraea soli TaxID=1032476 RepID=A0A7W0CEI5_9ACTN|nr:hypothetical protein [Nonomuraea soli]MBA2889684.1 hypothetical protein [Nonomuraea soli]
MPRSRAARPASGAVPRPRVAAQPRRVPSQARRPGNPRKQRTPFVLLVVGLMLGGLVSLLLLNTVLARDSITATQLQEEIATAKLQKASLEREVYQAQLPEEVAKRAEGQGMTPDDGINWLGNGR